MKENIFDLQTDIANLIVKHGLQDGEYAFVFRGGNLMVVDLSQIKLPEKDKNKEENKNSQETEKEL